MNRLLLICIAITCACSGTNPKPDIRSSNSSQPTHAGNASSVSPSKPDELPLWPVVRKGQLANGLTYYVMKHSKPEKRALMWLAVDAGSVDEDDDQRGLAHYVEHMAFNGTKRFPKDALVNYLQSIGMRFGADLNAYTSWQQTVYQLEVPTDKPEFLAKGLDILRDWAGSISFDPEEVKKESGVVLEEWRLGRGAGMRLFEKHAKVVLKDTRYANRIAIGLPEIIKAANRDALVRYYNDWYLPTHMAVIVVGEIDPREIEAAITARFTDLQKPAKARRRLPGGIPTAGGTRVSIETDAELPTPSIDILNLVPRRATSTAHDYRRLVVEQVYVNLVNERLAHVRRKPAAPFLNAATTIDTGVREIDVFSRSAQVKAGNVEQALRALYTETLRAERHGFAQAELDRAKAVVARRAEEAADKEATTESRAFADEITRNFFTAELMIGRAAERDLTNNYLPTISVEELNALAKTFGGAENRVVTVSLPAGVPTLSEARVQQIIAEVERTEIPAWVDKPLPTALLEKPPTPGKIVKEATVNSVGVTEWTLSNGARVIVKPTDFERDTVVVAATSPGGTALAADNDYYSARFSTAAVAVGGVANLDAEELAKVLAGKQVAITPSIGETTEGFNGQASPRDLETLFQLLHLRITAPRKDPEQFKIWQANSAEQVANQARSPEYQYARNTTEALYRNSIRRNLPKPDDFARVDLDKAMSFYRSRFGDVSDFTFVFVGELDLATLRRLVETYLASLPGKGRIEVEKDLKIRKVPHVVKKQWPLGTEPKASVQLQFHAGEAWSRDKERDMYVVSQALSHALREKMREDKSGVYGVSVNGAMLRSPYPERTFAISFGCEPARVDELIATVMATVEQISKDGIDAGRMDRLKQIYVRSREIDLRTNRFWLDRLTFAYRYRDDPTDILDTSKTLARMTNATLKAAVARFLDRKQVFTAIRLPAAAN